jgi:c-di-GMP-binding flagellar brake protein YcgR
MGRDISTGGIGVYLEKLPPIGSPIEVIFQFPRTESLIQITGEVMYHRRGGAGVRDDWLGIRFVRMDADSQSQILKFIKSSHDGSQPYTKTPPPIPGK